MIRIRATRMLILLSSFALMTTGCHVGVGDRMPDWTLKDLAGRPHSISSYSGQVIVLDFWATWCAPCMAVSPHLQAIQEKYADKGVVVLAVHFDDEGEPKRYMKRKRYTITVLDDGNAVANMLGVSRIPTIMIIDRDGQVAHRQVGFSPGNEAEIMKLIDRLLLETPNS